MICINGPEGFLPKKQNFMMQVVQVLWYRPGIIKKKDNINFQAFPLGARDYIIVSTLLYLSGCYAGYQPAIILLSRTDID